MNEVKLEKYPALKSNEVQKGGLRVYLRPYLLLLQRLELNAEDERESLNSEHFRSWLRNLIDPIAHEGDDVEFVKKCRKEVDKWLEEDEEFQGFHIGSEIVDEGSHGGLLSRRTMATVKTRAEVGNCMNGKSQEESTGDLKKVSDESICLFTDDWIDIEMRIKEWHEKFQEVYSNPKQGDILEFVVLPCEEGHSKIWFNCHREGG